MAQPHGQGGGAFGDIFIIFIFIFMIIAINYGLVGKNKSKNLPNIPNNIPSSISLVQDFNMLLISGKALSVIGWIVFVASCIIFLISTNMPNQERIGESVTSYLIAKFSLPGIIAGIFIIIFGQVITCFVSIARNTKTTNILLQKLLDSKNKKD